MSTDRIEFGEAFFLSIDLTWNDGHMDENNGLLMHKHGEKALQHAASDCAEHEGVAVIYACIPVGRVERDGSVSDWAAASQIEFMARAAQLVQAP